MWCEQSTKVKGSFGNSSLKLFRTFIDWTDIYEFFMRDLDLKICLLCSEKEWGRFLYISVTKSKLCNLVHACIHSLKTWRLQMKIFVTNLISIQNIVSQWSKIFYYFPRDSYSKMNRIGEKMNKHGIGINVRFSSASTIVATIWSHIVKRRESISVSLTTWCAFSGNNGDRNNNNCGPEETTN